MRHFIRHYAEMVIAMFAGMGLLGVPAGWALGAMGTSWSALHHDAPALMLFLMAVTMTVPMVGWMRYRGHGWQANAEMSRHRCCSPPSPSSVCSGAASSSISGHCW